MGGTLGFLAVVVALGAMFGKILHETGAVDQIAVKMLKSFGHSARIMPSALRGWSVRYRCSLKWRLFC
ncbi:low-affinity gluconate transporter [Escherichia coli]|nr:low-affinity gluconate transporter [Escherichia coli]